MAIDALTEEVASNLEEVAQVTRRLNTNNITILLGGLAVGAGIGFYFGRRFNRAKIRAEIYEEAEEEIKKIRDLYQQKTVAATPKPSVEDVVEEKGYSPAQEDHPERPLKPPVPVVEPPVVIVAPSNVIIETPGDGTGWNFAEELKRRSKDEPYVIHNDEFEQNESGYAHVTYTYYALDDVLVDEDERPLPHADLIVGQDNLKFGHGSGDPNVVFVRNDEMQLEMEIDRVPNSYEEEVLGLEHEESN